ncbi:hypothetical protein B9T11_08395 [Wohlfahrtiimonas chitiniclastica]|uniref:SGNH/GDSL hydrolase family protein n=1 Tax=Wohlfahrtiimonas chitiniclastica TaxID=400946 RepID=UPI000B9916AC|nr:SGNH/GDSL hydrolase family protein [Wohlfahrtiimonas chitiniclastica]OYQ71730.1 hypothetical protein B9T13_03415 [Wohlfahrtiimonas chitiniclastica]OYQ79243.1 hypothetical protein B9T11_08395 [Wohlfahrtiimonas chitiniclastica]OYQ85586.1 hypothetical protein B9T14_03610 [Wohlfahrtiimonas chitiniclastica]OYQ86178.1 hypothetical protein B9T15_01420 [Wohlfahrtiimonas chitiniclastica]
MMNLTKAFLVTTLVGCLLGCQSTDASNDNFLREQGPGIEDFGDRNGSALKAKMRDLLQYQNSVVTMTQFGDSHTAADFFTGPLRELMQNKFGNAGIGWVTPMQVKGQRHALMSWQPSNWEVMSSRNVNHLDFPMGGYVAKPLRKGSSLLATLNQEELTRGMWNVRLMVKSTKPEAIAVEDMKNRIRVSDGLLSRPSNGWQMIDLLTYLPFKIDAIDESAEIGGMWLQRYQKPGVILSGIGTNGAQQSIWNKWSPQWLDELAATTSDLVILEYGTNEAFNDTLDEKEYRKNLHNSIQTVRKTLPNAAILLVGASDSIKNGNGTRECTDKQPPSYAQVKKIQRAVAQSEGVLYWDWQKAMGGKCSMERWVSYDLGRPDLVHLSPKGYELSAKMLYKDLMKYFGLAP